MSQPTSSDRSAVSGDEDFLREQVQRLNASLGGYQKKHQQVPAGDGFLESHGRKASWLTNKRLLSPLLAEYDRIIEEMKQQISMYQAELESMSARIEQVTMENTELHAELRKCLEAQIQTATGSGAGGASVNEVMVTLQQQLEMISRDRDSYRDLLKKASQELELVQRNDQEKAKKLLENKLDVAEAQQVAATAKIAMEELQSTCVKLDEERARCLKAVQAQEEELTNLQGKFTQTKTELKTANIKNDELKKSLDEITFQLRKRESERARALDTENSLDDRIHIMQITNTDLEGKLLVAQRELAILNSEKTDLEDTLVSLQSKISALEQREYEAVCHVKESVQIAESALLEKDQATIRERQLVNEVERLKSTMATIVKEAGERTKKEVDSVRMECNKSIDKMGEEIHRLEQECGERQAQLERSQRERKTVEKELDKANARKPLEMVQTGENLYELQKRACLAERARDDLHVKVEALNATIKRLKSSLSQEKQAHVQLAEEHRKWQKQVQEESQQLREQKIKTMAHADELQHRLRSSEQAKEAAEMKLVQELTSLEHRQEVREREMAYRLESAEMAHQKSIQELRSLLTVQHRVGTKWREESKSLIQKFESNICDAKTESTRYKRRLDELTTQLNLLKRAKEDLAKQLNQATISNTTLQQRLKEAENQAETATNQVAQLLTREKQLLHERRELNKQLDKVKLHVARNTGNLPASSHMHRDAHKNLSSIKPYSQLPHDTSFQPHTSNIAYQDSLQWNYTLSQLKQSIQQVREGLGVDDSKEEDEISEHSTISKADLTQSVVS